MARLGSFCDQSRRSLDALDRRRLAPMALKLRAVWEYFGEIVSDDSAAPAKASYVFTTVGAFLRASMVRWPRPRVSRGGRRPCEIFGFNSSGVVGRRRGGKGRAGQPSSKAGTWRLFGHTWQGLGLSLSGRGLAFRRRRGRRPTSRDRVLIRPGRLGAEELDLEAARAGEKPALRRRFATATHKTTAKRTSRVNRGVKTDSYNENPSPETALRAHFGPAAAAVTRKR